MMCPICAEQNQKTRATLDVKDMRGHLKSMHTKQEILDMLAKILWNNNGVVTA